MLASDSDSDFEYADGNNSVASDDCALLGKLALGVDPQDMKEYDGRSTPQNGSQYLMKVMAEKKCVPKVVSVDKSRLSEKKKVGEEEAGATLPHPYINKFLQEDLDPNNDETAMNNFLLPSEKWREETTSCFSMLRTKVEAWHYKVEAKEIRITEQVKLPTNNDNTHWLKFCFGEGFLRLAADSKNKTKEQKLSDFFLDLYDPKITDSLLKPVPPLGEVNSVDQKSQENSEEQETQPSIIANETITADQVENPVTPQLQAGKRPLMNLVLQLNHMQLENLVKWNLLWVQNIGLVNECQGQWLYAILASLYKPIDSSVMSDLRSIVKCLIKIRSRFSNDWASYFTEVKEKQEADHNATCDERVFDFINTLNLFIYVIADYFKQTDLVKKNL